MQIRPPCYVLTLHTERTSQSGNVGTFVSIDLNKNIFMLRFLKKLMTAFICVSVVGQSL